MSDPHRGAHLPSGIELSNLEQDAASQRYRATAYFPPDAIMFKGHFPGDPIAPGHCLLELVLEILQSFGFPIEYKTIQSVKFYLPVRPGDESTMEIDMTPQTHGTFAADVTLQRENQPVLEVSAVLAPCCGPLAASQKG